MTSRHSPPPHTPLFIDANIFFYFLLYDDRYGESCQELLSRVETGELIGFVDPIVMSETLYLYLYVKTHVIATHDLTPNRFLDFTKRHPHVIAGVDITNVMRLFSIETLRVITPPHHVTLELWPRTQRYGLLPNDAYHVVTMRFMNLSWIASNDADFSRIPDLTLWKP